MKTQLRRASLEAKTAALRAMSAFTLDGVEVDEEAGVIRNCAVMTVGPARGWGWNIDATSLEQTKALIDAAGDKGIKVRFRHPEMPEEGQPIPDGLGTDVGYLRNARIVGESLRGDVHLQDYAEVLPQLGNVKAYLIRKAKTDPEGMGLSAVIGYEAVPIDDGRGGVSQLVARVYALDAVDFVGKPAANPRGLLSEPNKGEPGNVPVKKTSLRTKGTDTMDMKRKVMSELGLCAEDASDEVVNEAYDAADEDTKAKIDAKVAELLAEAESKRTSPTQKDEPSAAALAVKTGEEMIVLEGKRVAMLQQLGNTLNVDAVVIAQAIAQGDDVAKARTRYLTHLQEKTKPVANLKTDNGTRVGNDKKIAMLSAAIPDAILLRAGTERFYQFDERGRITRDADGKAKTRDTHEMAGKFASLSVLDMYRQYLVALGADVDKVMMLSRARLAELLGPKELRRTFPRVAALAQSTSDFDAILLDAQNKTLRQAYQEAPRTWSTWAKRATAPDFKNINRIALSEVPTLTELNEGKPIQYVTVSDSKEVYVLREFAGGLRLTRRSLINDDMDAFSTLPNKQAQAAARLEDDVAYAVLTANANMADGVPLFDAAHGNLVSGSGNVGSPSTVATISAAEKLMMLQKGPKNAAYLNIMPKFLIVPVSLKTAAETFVASRVDPTKSNEYPNPYQGKLQVVANARLDAASVTGWYLAADYREGIVDTIEVCFLTDEPEPRLRQETDFDTEDVKMAVTHVVAAKAIEYRGLVSNPGV